MDNEESDLIQRAAGGDAVAVQLLLVRHHAALVSHLERRLPAALAEFIAVDDLCQETYIRAMRKLADFQPTAEGGFSAWLRTIAERRLTDAIRAAKAAKRGGGQRISEPIGAEATSMVALLEILAVDEQTPSQSVARREFAEHVQASLEQLEADYREALRLRYVQGQGVAEIAAAMGRTEGAVKMLCNRGLKQLADRMGDLSPFVSRTLCLPPQRLKPEL